MLGEFSKAESVIFFKFLLFKAHVEKQSGDSIHILKADIGVEFCSNEFIKYW